jgi:iron complex outermembrane receptor protein
MNGSPALTDSTHEVPEVTKHNYIVSLIGGIGLVTLPATIALAASAAPVTAADTDGTLDEIVVTAQRRAENIQSVPVAITLVDEKQLDRQGVTSVTDLSKASASLEFSPPARSPGGGGIMRGIGTATFSSTAQASVGIVVDGVPMGNVSGLQIFDVDRVEILKGPQGTLFGGTVSAGVINMATKKPQLGVNSFHFYTEEAHKDAESDFTRSVLRGIGNIALGADSALRVAVHSDADIGLFHNTWQKDSDSSSHDNGIRARWLFKPSETFSIGVIGEYNDFVQRDYPTLVYRYAPPGSGMAAALAACGVTASPSNSDFCSETHYLDKFVNRNASVELNAAVGANTLTVVAADRNASAQDHGDIMGIPISVLFAHPVLAPLTAIRPGGYPFGAQSNERKQDSVEVRLASPTGQSLEWVAGAFGQNYKYDFQAPGYIGLRFVGNGQVPLINWSGGNVKNTEYAGFGNLTWHFGDATRLQVGGRYTSASVEETKTDTSATPNGPDYLKAKVNKFTYRVGLQHDFNSTMMGYVATSTGMKAPQISDNLQTPARMFAINAESPTSYELGLKSSVFGNRLAVNVDVFTMDVKDFQGQTCGPNAQGTITCTARNVPKLTTRGVELEVFGRPTERLTVNLSADYNPAKYPTGTLDETGADLGGTQLTYATREKATLSVEYGLPIANGYTVSFGADATYRGKISEYPRLSSVFIVPSSTLANLRVALKSSSNWTLAAFVRNVGRENYPREVYPTPFQPDGSLAATNQGLWQVFDANSKRLIGLQFDMTIGEK